VTVSGTQQTSAELVRHFFETLSTGDLERVRLLFHEDATWAVMADGIPGAGTHVGRDTIVDAFLAPVRGMFEPGDPKVTIDSLVAEGNLVAVEARGRGRFADGREYSNRYAFVLEVQDGLVVAIREYLDSYYISTLV
jgi:ketosteroid isomerase-like protein